MEPSPDLEFYGYPYFKRKEFTCRCGCDTEFSICKNLIDVLLDIRRVFGQPIYINSGYRCASHNDDIGGSTHSYHLAGMAADIRVKNIAPIHISQFLEVRHPNDMGIGVARTWMHVDVRKYKTRWKC